MDRRHATQRLGALVLVLGLVLAGCSSSGDDAATTTVPGPDASTSTTAPDADSDGPLVVVVTNDDGIGAPGIDVLASAISEIDDVEVHVVAPAENQSGTSDKTTDGEVAHADGKTVSGIEGTAVEGFPADSVGVALDDLGLDPDLVASGINEGQNVGPLAGLSGTVGAASTAARRGVPAVAGSAGVGDGADYDLAAGLVVDWIVENREALAARTMSTDTVVNINVPDCTVGSPRTVEHVEPAENIPEGMSPFTADCEAEVDFDTPSTDVEAVANGFIAISEIPVTDADADAAASDSEAPDSEAPDSESPDPDTPDRS